MHAIKGKVDCGKLVKYETPKVIFNTNRAHSMRKWIPNTNRKTRMYLRCCSEVIAIPTDILSSILATNHTLKPKEEMSL